MKVPQREANRDNLMKPRLSYALQFPRALEALARVKEYGGAKYGDGNWQSGGKPDAEYLDACCRHLVAFVSGETLAKDSRCAHVAHAFWNLMALIELNHPDDIIGDDFHAACEEVLAIRLAKEAASERDAAEADAQKLSDALWQHAGRAEHNFNT
jgi:hypothetical protein